ncbi:PI4-kinase, putative [Candida dubliniensis CD36]|uniref:Phosphatidylinositol 4-kinase n=1 Tax=Candida dubliniensis (strain CD36 / ATCC MYA-646 / CBS 7987 / NCPF 3949 / NRRL Y-17841) TaxID=573826 RepID=B9W808_CANDC|nr:PI4-kinase, putative [Candida dubliniensis CD36]CAX44823.1 PI4-kinase, putative [Candida dubliniensis CD36]
MPDSSVSNHDIKSMSHTNTITNNTSPFATLSSNMEKKTIDPETEHHHHHQHQDNGNGNEDKGTTINGKVGTLLSEQEANNRPIVHVNSLSKSWHYDTSNSASSKSAPNTPKIKSRSQPVSRRASVEDIHFQHIPSHHETHNYSFKNSVLIPAAKWAYSPISKMRRSTNPSITNNSQIHEEYLIEYSVFRPIKGLPELNSHKDILIHLRDTIESQTKKPFEFPETYISEIDFHNLLFKITKIIETDHIYPERITTGSSGSYFIFDIDFSLYKIGIFKPKDEEPYGPLSPKWTKWAHRTFFPCFFGRSCLIPNLGYISEAAACVLDRQLHSFIVPHTEIVELRSPTFFYSYWDKSNDVTKLPKKKGSLQLFLNGYINADIWLKIYPIPTNDVYLLKKTSRIEVPLDETKFLFTWSQESMQQFQEELEKLVILDYLMRNTDRGLDNWMIKLEWIEIKRKQSIKIMKPIIKIGAIDSGLAFPWKHPDEWRSFPFGWLFLPLSIIGQPFSRRTRNHYLPLLTSKKWWEETVIKLKDVFMQDNDFKERMWLKQLAVLKGQAFNIVEILKLTYAGPLELTRRENLLVIDDIMYMPNGKCDYDFMKSSLYESDIFKSYRVRSSDRNHRYDSDEELGQQEEGEGEVISPNTPLLAHPHNHYLEVINESFDDTNESGYEHMNRENNVAATDKGKKVIIERLIKETSKPPVFTWC